MITAIVLVATTAFGRQIEPWLTSLAGLVIATPALGEPAGALYAASPSGGGALLRERDLLQDCTSQ